MRTHPIMSQSPIDLIPDGGAATDEVRTQVWGLISSLYPRNGILERRRETRCPFPHLIQLVPANDRGEPCGESIVVAGKHVSERGLSFYHPKPLPFRRVIASLESGNGHWFGFLVDLNWCRFTKAGWYESGGRFVEAVASPVEP